MRLALKAGFRAQSLYKQPSIGYLSETRKMPGAASSRWEPVRCCEDRTLGQEASEVCSGCTPATRPSGSATWVRTWEDFAAGSSSDSTQLGCVGSRSPQEYSAASYSVLSVSSGWHSFRFLKKTHPLKPCEL